MIDQIERMMEKRKRQGWRLIQQAGEYADMIRVLRAREVRPHSLLEIGCCTGAWSDMTAELLGVGHVYLVDIDLKLLEVGRQRSRHLRDAWAFQGDSRSPETISAVKHAAGGAVDIVHIDGGHSYGNAKHDYEVYGRMARQAIIIHDIHGWHGRPNGVERLWREIVGRRDTVAVIGADPPKDPTKNYGSGGIGIIFPEEKA